MSDDSLTREILDSLPVPVFLKDRQGNFLYVNRATAELFRTEPEYLIGKSDGELISPEAIETYAEDDRKVIESGTSVTQEEFLHTHSGERVILQVRKIPLMNSSGAVQSVLGIAIDITSLGAEHERLALRLEEKEQVLRDATQQLEELAAPLPAAPKRPPKVFVSYKHSHDEHRKWVSQFTADLMEVHEIDCMLDQFDLDYGDSIQSFMQRIQTDATHFLMVITPEAVSAIEQSAGGVAFESQLAATRRAEGSLRLIPVLREGDQSPAYVRSHLYIDFRNDAIYLDMLKRLAMAIKGVRKRPILGSRKHEA